MSFLQQLLWKAQYGGSGPGISLNYPKAKTRTVSAVILKAKLCRRLYHILEPFFNESGGVRFNLPNPSFIHKNISGFFFTAWICMIWLREIKKNLLLAKNFCIFIKHFFKRVMSVSGRKKKAVKDIRFKCYQMWAKHWREVLKYLRLCLHVFSGSVSYDVTASARDSLLQWLLELNASFFHILTQTHAHAYKNMYLYMYTCTQRDKHGVTQLCVLLA